MLKRSELFIGAVVRLASGSPKFVIEALEDDGTVGLIGWTDAVGFVTEDVLPSSLVWPRPPEERDATPPKDA